MAAIAIEPAPLVDLLDDDPLEVELAATLLYQHSHHSYRQIRDVVEGLPEAQRRESSIWACGIAAVTTRFRAPSAPGSISASTS